MAKANTNEVKYSELSQEELAALAQKQAEDISGLTKSNGELTDEVKALGGQNESLTKENKELEELNAELQAKAEAAGANSGVPEVTCDKEVYQVMIPKFSFGGVQYTVVDLQNDPALVKKLVKIESGVLKLKEAK